MSRPWSNIEVDGSLGEGGGQILRSSLALSMATGRAFRIVNIRAGRPKPGLMRQHLMCVRAAAEICSAKVEGDAVGSREVRFEPGAIRAGEYRFAIGTAGGTMLVLQAVLPALLIADGPSRVTVEGGTHNTHAPPFEFFERALVPLINRTGATVAARLEKHGFYPAGGGRVVVDVTPAPKGEAKPLEVLTRGPRLEAMATAITSKLSRAIAERELDVLHDRLALSEDETTVHEVTGAASPGNVVLVELRYEQVTEVFSAIGELGKSAESVARGVSDEARAYIGSQRPIGPHLADQLMVPLAVLAGGRYATGELTEHSTTNMATLAAFGGWVALQPDGVLAVRALADA